MKGIGGALILFCGLYFLAYFQQEKKVEKSYNESPWQSFFNGEHNILAEYKPMAIIAGIAGLSLFICAPDTKS